MSYIVDHGHLADLILRRCGDCTDAYHIEVAERFLDQEGFDDDDRQEVMKVLLRRLEQRSERQHEPPRWRPAKAGALCDICGMAYADHDADEEWPELTVLCDGSRVQL